jgi:hypothetical protein
MVLPAVSIFVDHNPLSIPSGPAIRPIVQPVGTGSSDPQGSRPADVILNVTKGGTARPPIR